MPRPNVFDSEAALDPDDPPGYRSGRAQMGKAAGGEAIAVNVFELAPGESVCPYHYEYEEEWLIVLSGGVELRTPAAEEQLRAGDVVCFPPGPDGAHKVTATSEQPARVLMFSSARTPSVAVYPDSDKIGAWPGNPADNVMLRRSDGAVAYFEGETR